MPDYEIVDVSAGTEITSPTPNEMIVAFNNSTSALEKIPFSGLVEAVNNGVNAGIEIVAETDLDNLTTPGIYISSDSTRTATLTNCPVSSAGFVMCVYSHSVHGKIQMILNGSNAFVHIRAKKSSGWSEWKTVNGSVNVPFTAESGVTNNLSIKSSNGVVTVNGYCTFETAPTAKVNIGTIDEKYKPASVLRFTGAMAQYAYLPGTSCFVAINASGIVSVTPPANNTYKNLYFSVSYII